MELTITGKHLEITPAIRQYIESKISKVEKIFQPVLDVHVIISVAKYLHVVEIVLHTNTSIIRVSSKSEDMYASIDLTTEKLVQQVRKVKEKLKDHKHREPRIDEMIPAEEVDISEDEEKSSNVFLKQVEVKPMDVEEAIMQLETLGAAFLLFKRLETGSLSVIYKNKAGDYNLLEPERK